MGTLARIKPKAQGLRLGTVRAPRRIPSAQLHHGTHRRPPCARPLPLARREGQGSASSKLVKRLPGGPRSAASPTGPRHSQLGALGYIPRTASPVARRVDDRIASRRKLVDGGKPAVPKTHPTVAVLYHASPASFIPREGGRSPARDHRTGTALRGGAAPVRAHGPCFEYSGFSDGDEPSGRPGIRRAVRACASEAKRRVLRGAFNSP